MRLTVTSKGWPESVEVQHVPALVVSIAGASYVQAQADRNAMSGRQASGRLVTERSEALGPV